jgi:hypothetical protein
MRRPWSWLSAKGADAASRADGRSSFIPTGTVGVIGSETLINYNPVLVDYTDGERFLGQGKRAQSATSEHPTSSP